MATKAEDKEWERFVTDVREQVVTKMVDSAFVMSLVPDAEPDIKFAVELGLGIMLDKPIVLLSIQGRDIPAGLRRVAHAIIEIDDFDTEAGQLELQRKIGEVMHELGLAE